MLDTLQNVNLFEDGEDLKSLFDRYDSDHDGILTWDEAWKAMEPVYEKLDG